MEEKTRDFFKYLEIEKNYSKNTILSYKNDIENFRAFLGSRSKETETKRTFENVSSRDLRLWLAQRSGQGLSSRSSARALATIRSFYRFLEKRHGLENKTIFEIRGPKLPKLLPKNINHSSIIRMIQSVENFRRRDWEIKRDVALIILLYSCGLRISEALDLEPTFFLGDDRIKILGKGARERIVRLLPIAVESLGSYRKACPYDTWNGNIIFFGTRGKKYQAALFEKLIQNIRNFLNLPQSATPHSLRHSFATELLASGADLRSIQELLGHSSLKTTQLYTRVDPSNILKVYNATHPASIAENLAAEEKKS
ncbi:MAG: tyrosine recombinase XerC [Rickettsiales bacterium]|jgi:integrase/recombinase XerC|nr:tyrosine recombinase XerC [Rickettsiales bacterium]